MMSLLGSTPKISKQNDWRRQQMEKDQKIIAKKKTTPG